MVRPSPPRFLNFGDRFELPVVVQNQTDSPMQVDVAVRATNASLTADAASVTLAASRSTSAPEGAGAGKTITVPANDRVELRFPAAAVRAGTARFQVVASSGKWADAASFELPVWTPATTEAFATYGEIDSGAIAQQVLAPANAVSQFGGLEISTSSTELQSLTDAVIYLTHYPFECSEQISSRVLAISALRDVLSAFHAKGLPKPEELTATVDNDIKRLKAMQNEDGGFGFWRKGDEEWPYLGIHVAHALERARLKKFDVPSGMLEKSRGYLREIDRHIPAYYGVRTRRALEAYALYVRNLMSDKDPARARQLIAEEGLGGLSMESIGWLLPVLSDDPASRTQVAAIRQYLNNHAEEEAGTAHFTTSYSDGDHLLLHSSRRDDGVILDALIGDQPTNDLIPKIVRGLLAHRTAGRWDNTQENAWVLLALDRYFNTYEKATPNFTARTWLGDAYAGGHDFKGRTTERTYLSVPMAYLMQTAGPEKLVLSKEGTGRMYYRVGMEYAPTDLKIKPADYGFAVTRTYEAIDNPSDVRHDPDGTWHIKAGTTVRVRLTMVAQARRYHVALVDPIPAGLEALNPELAVTGSIPQDPKSEVTTKRWWWWTRPWFEHQNMRDERVEAFTSLLWEGVYNYSYVARATTPGVFVVPPPKAEEMYHPETFGRGATDRVIVE
jgi:alpha-2-macroglobulin